ncbi:Gaa1-like protein [Sphaerosporella brunnea]|uniref:Gaa1-like protein n=1 Tax=Sphaerosporella brunnea TaxID=1250544 RepID=A0A5J5F081_9PEZI|nr:Gaa1-like protein [Sphaerosporella brunnea]
MALPRPLRSAKILKFLPFLSILCVLVGVTWLLLLPLDEYSRNTYISENALLPGGVHTYFSGSEQNVFRAYRHEVKALQHAPIEQMIETIESIFKGQGLKVGTQKFRYEAGGKIYEGENVYAVLEAPRGDATEAVVLAAPWINGDDQLNQSGVALVMALARYFKRWSLWSKDVIFLITSDARAGPQAWVDAYHDTHTPGVASLPLTSGALQGVVVLDYPTTNPWDRIHVLYDGINGQLPNLDLFNTAVHISGHQMGVRASLQEMFEHNDSYEDRLRTMLRGMVNQGLGHATGPHSVFIPYHIDAVTLQVSGIGHHDEVTMGRILESLFRSLNNLLEHFHQSFFFYLLLAPRKFVSIGTYLPSAMLIAVNFTITAIGLWIKSGKRSSVSSHGEDTPEPSSITEEKKPLIQEASSSAIPSNSSPITVTEHSRSLLLPISFILALHFLSFLPLYIFNTYPSPLLTPLFALLSLLLPPVLSRLLHLFSPTAQDYELIKCFSLLLLGLFLSALATLNFSLSFLVGLFSVPFSFVAPQPSGRRWVALLMGAALQVLAPTTALLGVAVYMREGVERILLEAAFGWRVWGMWTQVVVWCVWWPAWVAAGVGVVSSWCGVAEDKEKSR